MEKLKIEQDIKKAVSYSQFSTWYNCRYKFYLDKIKGLKEFEDNINTCFGTAMHETLQLYIKTLYQESVTKADSYDLHIIFKNRFLEELTNKKVNVEKNVLDEFCCDGNNIISSFIDIKNRMKYFPSQKYECISIEDEIILPIKNNVNFICYIDVILKEKATGRYKIIDIKTSTQGWNSYTKEDESKISQILLYKAFFSKKYNVNIDMIDVEFFILKRKLWENYNYPQSRIQTFVPKNDQKHIAKSLNLFSEFISECFTEEGGYIENDKNYLKNPGKSCKFCPHKGKNCNGK